MWSVLTSLPMPIIIISKGESFVNRYYVDFLKLKFMGF